MYLYLCVCVTINVRVYIYKNVFYTYRHIAAPSQFLLGSYKAVLLH